MNGLEKGMASLYAGYPLTTLGDTAQFYKTTIKTAIKIFYLFFYFSFMQLA